MELWYLQMYWMMSRMIVLTIWWPFWVLGRLMCRVLMMWKELRLTLLSQGASRVLRLREGGAPQGSVPRGAGQGGQRGSRGWRC